MTQKFGPRPARHLARANFEDGVRMTLLEDDMDNLDRQRAEDRHEFLSSVAEIKKLLFGGMVTFGGAAVAFIGNLLRGF